MHCETSWPWCILLQSARLLLLPAVPVAIHHHCWLIVTFLNFLKLPLPTTSLLTVLLQFWCHLQCCCLLLPTGWLLLCCWFGLWLWKRSQPCQCRWSVPILLTDNPDYCYNVFWTMYCGRGTVAVAVIALLLLAVANWLIATLLLLWYMTVKRSHAADRSQFHCCKADKVTAVSTSMFFIKYSFCCCGCHHSLRWCQCHRCFCSSRCRLINASLDCC